jgi:hypothetical protein
MYMFLQIEKVKPFLFQASVPTHNEASEKEVGQGIVRSFQNSFNCSLFLNAAPNEHRDLKS